MRPWKSASASLAQLSFESYGAKVVVEAAARDLEAQIAEILPPGWRSCRPSRSAARFRLEDVGDGLYRLTIDGHSWVDPGDLATALGVMDAQMRLFIATNARGHVFVHAGVVAVGDRALLLPGPSFSGKSTLVKALVDAGATYYSDEYAVLDETGRVHPYPRRLSLRTGLIGEEHDVGAAGGSVGDRAAEVALVAMTQFRPGATWAPRRLGAGQGATMLMSNTIPAQDRPRDALRAVGRAANGALVIEGERGEAAPVAEALLRDLRDQRRAAEP